MPTRLTSALIFSLALISSACGSSMKPSDIKQNPHPKQRYEVTLSIDGAPGSFDAVTGFMQYEVAKNDPCAPKDPISGLHDIPEQHPPITFAKVGEHTYTGTVYTDLMQDDDYYGMGVCHWHMTFAVSLLKSKNNGVSFSPDLSLDEISAQQSKDFYFSKAAYLDTKSPSYPDSGQSLTDTVKKYRSDFFRISISAKEVTP